MLIQAEMDVRAKKLLDGRSGGLEFSTGNLTVAVGVNPRDALQGGKVVREFELDRTRSDHHAGVAGIRVVSESATGQREQ